MAASEFKPDINSYLQSISDELLSVQNRIRNLVRHWPTDGEHKEAALRLVLRRHLPTSLLVGRGFIATRDESSTQLDVLIVSADQPLLFRDGDLMIVTQDTVKGLIEVKTRCDSVKVVGKVVTKLLTSAAMCSTKEPWTGVFIYEDKLSHEELLSAVKQGSRGLPRGLDFLCSGRDKFVMRTNKGWSCYDVEGCAPALFVGALALDASGGSKGESGCIWLPGDSELTRFCKGSVEL
jgi:hypothetical protein